MPVTVVKFNSRTAVVQKSGYAQHFNVLTGKFMQHSELFIKLNGEIADLLRVRNVYVVIAHQRIGRKAHNVAQGFFYRTGNSVIEHYSLAYACAGNYDIFKSGIFKKALDGSKRRDENIGALGIKPLDLRAFFRLENFDHIVNAVEIIPADVEVMNHIQRITLDTLDYTRQVSERTADADKLHVGIKLLKPGYFLKLLENVGFDLLGLLLRL